LITRADTTIDFTPVADSRSPCAGGTIFPKRGRLSTHPEAVEIVLYVDEDDFESHHLDHPDIQIDKIIGSRLTMGGL